MFHTGTEFLYSTYSWNLVSAVVEGASGGQRFTDIMKDIFFKLGLENTFLDENLPIINNRAR
jgi:serine beta-lactamase-like protein LACTB, mitochondrial